MLPDLDALWDYNDPAASEARFRAALPAAEAAGDADYCLQLLTQVARAQGLQRRYADAHATLDQVRDHLDADGQDLPAVRARYLLERGRVHNDSGQHEQAKACFLDAWERAKAAGLDALAIDAAHMMGIIEPALEWNERAVAYAMASPDPKARRWLASLQNNIGWTYHARGDYPRALQALEDALRLRIEQGKPGPIRIARWSVAKLQRLLGRVDEALATQQSLAAELAAAGEIDGYTREELAECLLAVGRGEEARTHFARAHDLLSKDPWFPKDETARLDRLKRLAGT